MDIRCRLRIHDWKKYSSAVTAVGGLTQFRYCDRCNKISWVKFYGNQAHCSEMNKALGFDNIEIKGDRG